MSRFKRTLHGVASGYAVLVATAVYGLASVPLALHYLPTERFALWALMSTISGYLALIDIGMSGSIARLLVDHKDDKKTGHYGQLVQTGGLVLVAQACLVLLAGYCAAPLLQHVLKIEPELQVEFVALVRWQALALAITFAFRIFAHILQAHQRLDLGNYSAIAALFVSFSALWLFFASGEGVFSFAWAALLSAGVGAGICIISCLMLGLLPPAGAWGRIRWTQFCEIFAYGKDIFLVVLGTQLIMASQTMIVTRRLGLEAAALWAVGTRTFLLISQVVWRLSDVAGPAFSEMIVRSEQALLKVRYKAVTMLTASMSGFAAVSLVMCNNLFVSLWTHNKLYWPTVNDVFLGVWLIILAIQHCHSTFVLVTKRIGSMRYIYFIEGTVFISVALAVVKLGLPAMVSASILCTSTFTLTYCILRISRHFGFSVRELVFEWQTPMLRGLAIFGPAAVLGWLLFRPVHPPVLRLGAHIGFCVMVGAFVFLRFGISEDAQRQMLARAPKQISRILKLTLALRETV